MKKEYIKPSVKAVEIEVTGALCDPSNPSIPINNTTTEESAWSKEDLDDEDLW